MSEEQTTPRWAAIPAFPGYEVSDTGDVRGPGGSRPCRWVSRNSLMVRMLRPDGRRGTRNMRDLVMSAWGPARPKGDFKVRCRGELTDCAVESIEWYAPDRITNRKAPGPRPPRTTPKAPTIRVSTSFNPAQVRLLDNILTALQFERDPRMVDRERKETLVSLKLHLSRLRTAQLRRVSARASVLQATG